jgi:hypothetical protein
VTKTERWLNLLAFLLDRHYPVPREEILSQVEDYKDDWVGGMTDWRLADDGGSFVVKVRPPASR